jgi:hypothetical protein
MRDPPSTRHRNPDAPRAPNGRHHGNGGGHSRRLTGSAAVELAKAHLLELTGQPAESVSSLGRTREGWRITLEIPRTTDILASYVVGLDDEGELMSYERVARYYRNEVRSEQ